MGRVDVDDRAGHWLELGIVAGGVEVGSSEVGGRNLAGSSQVDPDPVPGGAAELDPAHIGVTTVLLWPGIPNGLVRDGPLPAPEQPAALPVRVGLVGTRAEPGDRLEPRDGLEHGPDAGDVGQLGREHGHLIDPHGAIREGAEALLVMYGDSYLFLNFAKMMSYFCSQNKLGLDTIFKNDDSYDKSNIAVKNNMVAKYSKAEQTQDMVYIDYGAVIFRKEVLQLIPENRFSPLEDLFIRLIGIEQLLAFEVTERFY